MSRGPAGSAVHVVAAAVTDAAGRILIAQRPPGKHLAGGWEFPGGKLEPHEDRRTGLARELREELGIVISSPRPLIRVRHAYDFGEVLIDTWVVRHYQGEPKGLDGQRLSWCTQAELERVEMLPADGPIVAALRLPERLTQIETDDYIVSDLCGRDAGGRLQGTFCRGLTDAVAASDAGADFVVLQNELTPAELQSICELLPIPVYSPSRVPETAWMLGATGISQLTA